MTVTLAGRDFLPCQIPIDLVMRKPLTVLSKVGQGVVDLADQQILAIVQPNNGLFYTLTLANHIWL